MNDDLLSKCVVDTSKRTVYLYSDGGDKKTVNCDTVEEFMNVLSFVRDKVEKRGYFIQTLSEGKSTFYSKKGAKKTLGKNCPISFFQILFHALILSSLPLLHAMLAQKLLLQLDPLQYRHLFHRSNFLLFL